MCLIFPQETQHHACSAECSYRILYILNLIIIFYSLKSRCLFVTVKWEYFCLPPPQQHTSWPSHHNPHLPACSTRRPVLQQLIWFWMCWFPNLLFVSAISHPPFSPSLLPLFQSTSDEWEAETDLKGKWTDRCSDPKIVTRSGCAFGKRSVLQTIPSWFWWRKATEQINAHRDAGGN